MRASWEQHFPTHGSQWRDPITGACGERECAEYEAGLGPEIHLLHTQQTGQRKGPASAGRKQQHP